MFEGCLGEGSLFKNQIVEGHSSQFLASELPKRKIFKKTIRFSMSLYTDKTTLRVIRRLGGGGGSGEKETTAVLTVAMVAAVMAARLR